MIPINEPLLNGNEKKYLAECIDSGWISSDGPFVSEFEERFAARVGRKHAIAVTNGTAALEAAVAALDIGVGHEVILPTFTIISCAAAIIRSGATPVLVDSDPITWNMDIDQVASKITPKTKAIIVVHTYGLPVDMEPLLQLANHYGIRVIEDAAQMHGQTYRGRPCGCFGDLSTFSFYANKHITTGEGGMIVTDDDRIARCCRSLRNLCFEPAKRFVHESLGWNLRMTNLQAAVGLAQLENLNKSVNRKREIGQYYDQLLGTSEELQLPLKQTDYAENIYWVFGIVLKGHRLLDSEGVMALLSSARIGTRPFFWPMHEQPVFKKRGMFGGERYPVAERLARKGFYVPCGIALSDNQIERVVDELKQIFHDDL